VPSVEAAVCNIALLRIGQLVTLSSLEDNSPYGRACKALWELSRDAVLEAKWWTFARRRATLAQLADSDGEPIGAGPFTYSYTLPSDYIAARYIETDDLQPGEGEHIPFEIELNAAASARVLLSNEETVELVYTAKVEAMGLWSPMARDALAMKIAGDLAMSVAKKPQLGLKLLEAWVAFVGAASAANANQRRAAEPPESALITSRA
jgi:hypothetical protein